MAAAEGAVEARLGAPGPWAQRRIPFQITTTYSSPPTMEPLNEPVMARAEVGNGTVAGNLPYSNHANHHQQQQQQPQLYRRSQQNQEKSTGGNTKLGRAEPLSLPSSMPLQWQSPQKIGAGLSNLGNTCFLNSVLQCLTYTPPLAGYLQSGLHKASCRVAGFCAFCALQEHVQQALASSGKVVSPQKLAKNLRSICRSFKMGRQEDSHEYMRYLLDALHKCCLPPDLAKNSNSKPSQEKSLVYRIFGGQLRSQVKCTSCSHCSNTYDPFLDLSLEISRADSLAKALARFTTVEVLDGENKYRCLRCKKKVRALKCFTIDLVPNILTIQFKRFAGGHGGKIDKKVEFGTTLDLKPFVSSGQDSVPVYKLFGVLVHSGWSTHSGHYYSFLRASSDIWHVFDDTRVRQVSEKTVLEQKAYMLFYVRESKKTNSGGHPDSTLTMQPRQLRVGLKEQASNGAVEATVNPRQIQPPSAAPSLPNGKDSSPLPDVPPMRHLPSSNPSVPSEIGKVSESNGHGTTVPVSLPAAVAAGVAPPQPVTVSIEKPKTSEVVMPQEVTGVNGVNGVNGVHGVNGVNGATSGILRPDPVLNANDQRDMAGEPPRDFATGCVDESAVGLCPPAPAPAAEQPGPTEVNHHNSEMEGRSGCNTSVNQAQAGDGDWDEYYQKGWSASGSTPQNYLKMLRVIPHTRRYYQAKALPARRSTRIASNGDGDMEELPPEAVKATGDANKDVKRPHSSDDDARGAKRQNRDSGSSRLSSTCMAMEELSRVEPMEVTTSEEHGGDVQQNGLHIRHEAAIADESGSIPDVSSARYNSNGAAPEVAERLNAAPGEKSNTPRGNEQNDFSHDPVKETVISDKDPQHPGPEAEVRPDDPAEISQEKMQSCDLGVEVKTQASASGSDRVSSGYTPAAGISNGTGAPVAAWNSLYDDAVPRWGDTEGNASTKDVDRLLEAEKSSGFEQDVWDVEYDKGRSKKIRNKASREGPANEISGSGTENVAPKPPSNPFQVFGSAKQRGNGVKKTNSIGFKAGYGYGLKTGKNIAAPGGQTVKSP